MLSSQVTYWQLIECQIVGCSWKIRAILIEILHWAASCDATFKYMYVFSCTYCFIYHTEFGSRGSLATWRCHTPASLGRAKESNFWNIPTNLLFLISYMGWFCWQHWTVTSSKKRKVTLKRCQFNLRSKNLLWKDKHEWHYK